jgi:DNA-directed RNA polymerase specialized sigma24 family protein
MSATLEQLGERVIELLPRLRRLAQAILETGPAADPARHADDVVQACIEHVLRAQPHWQDQHAFEHGMFSMLTRACAAAHWQVPATGPAARPAQPTERSSAWALRHRYAELPLQQRAAIALVVLEQRSYRDAADMLEMPLPALTQQLWQGREKLRAQLQA